MCKTNRLPVRHLGKYSTTEDRILSQQQCRKANALHIGWFDEKLMYYKTDIYRDRGATLSDWGPPLVTQSLGGGGGGHKTLFLTNSL